VQPAQLVLEQLVQLELQEQLAQELEQPARLEQQALPVQRVQRVQRVPPEPLVQPGSPSGTSTTP
jgi:hypothetical protein